MSPPLMERLSRRRANRRQKPLWEGVYAHYQDVPCLGRGFDDDYWVEETRRLTEELIELESISEFPGSVLEDHAWLPSTVAPLLEKEKQFSVLDFGGGMGVSYLVLRRSLPSSHGFRTEVVECPRVCQVGAELFAGDENISFSESLPEPSEAFDLVYICSALQYIEDYAGLLRQLASFRPKAILLAKTSAGKMPGYATAQVNVPGSSIPYWILQEEEISDILAEAGYRLGCQGVLPRIYYQDNFPESTRFGRARNFLFFRETS